MRLSYSDIIAAARFVNTFEKIAEDQEQDNFDEEPGDQSDPEMGGEQQGYEEQPPEEGQGDEQYEDQGEQQLSPEESGAGAAQSFMAPFIERAMSGDPSAIDTVSRAAGQVAASVTEAAAKSQAAEQPAEEEYYEDGDEQGAPQDQQYQGEVSPEEEMADEIVGQVPEPPAIVPNGQQQQ